MTEETRQERDTPGKVRSDLEARIEALEVVIATMAHQAGIPNSVLLENNVKPYEIQQKDLRKYA